MDENTITPRFESAPARSLLPDWYPDLLDRVAAHVASGHRRAVTAANKELLAGYWSIGREILDRQHEEGWGTKVIDRLSADLKTRFPGTRGYSPRNLKYMRAFAAAWPDASIVQRTVAQLPWRHHIALLDKVDDADLRLWYAAAAVERGWSRDVLALQIEGRFHERAGRAVTNFAVAMTPERSDLAQQATRDPYLFDFIGATDTWREREVEEKLVEHVGKFLLELGQGFAFLGRQVRLELAGDEFFCDLLFYHLELRCYVVIELKAVKFDASFLGQLGLYMAVVDDVLAKEGDKPTIGLLLCRNKKEVVAEYALRNFKAPIGVAEWTTAINNSLPEEFESALPSVAELEAELALATEEG
ncbi:YhcG family protein [Kribbella sp. VKM Ac-2568]|uniref:PDDEXK nuclease domain-containing protein n=1 Tax=Kribbella sp. VKM Ac-2568 TaxID=2512219 RepID=UPI0010432BBA|nr:PDDEXK nuclease domain-containing protein [Kribbella sp. VKM Ac-2568]